ncbi:hypothetical protein EVAR_7481_1 [Eumeta japonica]|uniref:Uncharacterized protein n=1 Tax=Eumeta variegata TaxID=151549 RepID=A0A4C1Y6Z1_EUMVA|nr:hypothetical protein EVAR_7481_1 [Eumeta japonica]
MCLGTLRGAGHSVRCTMRGRSAKRSRWSLTEHLLHLYIGKHVKLSVSVVVTILVTAATDKTRPGEGGATPKPDRNQK